jgi:hypothetical protein
MPEYRFYYIHADGRFTGRSDHDGPDDEAAIRHARNELARHAGAAAVEIWIEDRHVAVIRRE